MWTKTLVGIWRSVTNGKLQKNSHSKILWVFTSREWPACQFCPSGFRFFTGAISLVFRETCDTGWRILTAGISTASFLKLGREREFSQMMSKNQSWLRRGLWVTLAMWIKTDLTIFACDVLCWVQLFDTIALSALCDVTRSAGRRRTSGGPLKAPTWPHFIRGALHFGVERSSSRSRDSVTKGCSSLTSLRAKGILGNAVCVEYLMPRTCNLCRRFVSNWIAVMVYCSFYRYMVTFSPLVDMKDDPQAIIIWDVLTGQKKRGFHCESSAHWPIFK